MLILANYAMLYVGGINVYERVYMDLRAIGRSGQHCGGHVYARLEY